MKYLWSHEGALRQALKTHPRIFLFLDFDGTLAEIAPTPDSVTLPQTARKLLSALARKIKLAIITGRSISDLKKYFSLPAVIYSGSHGREFQWGKNRIIVKPSKAVMNSLSVVTTSLKQLRKKFPGMLLEHKPFGIAVHYRLVDPELRGELKKACQAVWRSHLVRLEVVPGKMVYDVTSKTPAGTKGQAVARLLRTRGGKGKVLPIYIGDDLSDETVFRVLRKMGGLTIHVGAQVRSTAEYYLKDPKDVLKWLRAVLRKY